MAVNLGNAFVEELPHHRQKGHLIAGDIDLGCSKDKAVIAFIATAVEEGRGFSVRPGNDNPADFHQVQLEAGCIKAFDLFIHRYQNLAGLMATFFNTRLLILNVITGNAGFNKAADQITHMGVATMAGIGVGNDEGAVIDLGNLFLLFITHAQAQKILIAICRQQCPHQWRGFIGNLTQRITGKVRSGIFLFGAFGGSCPAT